MTSPINDAETRAFFAQHRYFLAFSEHVSFFVQGTMPAVDIQTGRVLLAERGEVFTSPNGHGGTLLAMREARCFGRHGQCGCDLAFYFQVDNPFIDILDPGFIGYHIIQQADVSLKVIRKSHAAEKLGLVVRYDGQPTIIEYSDLPDEVARRGQTRKGIFFFGPVRSRFTCSGEHSLNASPVATLAFPFISRKESSFHR